MPSIASRTVRSRVDRVLDVDGQRPAHGRDLVAELAVLVRGPDRDGDQRPQLEALGADAAARAASAARAPATTARTTSLTVPPSSRLIRLKSSSSAPDPDEAAVRADRRVERHLRGGVDERPGDLADALDRLLDAAHRRLRRPDRRRRPGERRRSAYGRPRRCRERRARRRRARLRDPLVLGRGRLRNGLDVEQDGRDVDAGDAVDERVMGLRDQREAALAQSLDQPELPERLRAVEPLREDAGGHAAAARPRRRAPAAPSGGRGSRC